MSVINKINKVSPIANSPNLKPKILIPMKVLTNNKDEIKNSANEYLNTLFCKINVNI